MARRKRGEFLSKQPGAPGGKFSRRLFIWIAVIAGVLVILVLGAYLYVLSWLQGDSCRAMIEREIRQVSHAGQVTVPEPLQVDGTNLILPQISILRAGHFEELRVNKLHIGLDRSALFRRILRTRQFSAEELRFVIRAGGGAPAETAAPADVGAPTGQTAFPQAESRTATDSTTGATTDSVAQHSGFFKDIQLRSFEALYADTTVNFGKRFAALKGYRLIAKPDPASERGAWDVNIENGQVVTPYSWLNECGVRSANLRVTKEEVRLTSCDMLAVPGGARVNGTFSMKTGEWKARVHIDRVVLARFLRADWKKKVTGVLDGEMAFSGQVGQAWKAGGGLDVKDGVIEAFPVLSALKIDRTYPYRSIRIEKAACNISFPYSEPRHNIRDAWLWDNIDIRSRGGTLLIRGRVVTGQDGSLSGTLKIGIPARYVALLGLGDSPLAQQLFTGEVGEDEYLWLHVNLSGTLEDPHEDLSARLETILPKILSTLPGEAIKKLHGVLGGFLPAQPDGEAGEQPKQDEDTDAPAEQESPSQPVDAVKDIIKSGIDIFL